MVSKVAEQRVLFICLELLALFDIPETRGECGSDALRRFFMR